MMRVFCGFDHRESEGWSAFTRSVVEHCTDPVALIPLSGAQRDGTNAFTYERFRIPDICGWAGDALFLDGSDMLLRADLADLERLRDRRYAVQVVKHDYRTQHPRKYLGTPMEAANRDYPRKNWSSVVIWNCGHIAHFRARERIREAIAAGDGAFLHRFGWLSDDLIGELPFEWNLLVSEYPYNAKAKLAHFTCGIPCWPAYAGCDYADEWRGEQAPEQRKAA